MAKCNQSTSLPFKGLTADSCLFLIVTRPFRCSTVPDIFWTVDVIVGFVNTLSYIVQSFFDVRFVNCLSMHVCVFVCYGMTQYTILSPSQPHLHCHCPHPHHIVPVPTRQGHVYVHVFIFSTNRNSCTVNCRVPKSHKQHDGTILLLCNVVTEWFSYIAITHSF